MITDEQIETLRELMAVLSTRVSGPISAENERQVDAIRAALADAKKYRWVCENAMGVPMPVEVDGDWRQLSRWGLPLLPTYRKTFDKAVTKAMEVSDE